MVPRDSMDKNLAWFTRADLSAYEGRYVAIAHERVVASGDDPGVVYETAKSQEPHEEILLWKVMPAGAFVFHLMLAHGG